MMNDDLEANHKMNEISIVLDLMENANSHNLNF